MALGLQRFYRWRSPQVVGVLTVLVCIISGALVLVALIHDLVAPHWSRPAIFLQVVALLLALLWTPWLPARRLIIHPLLLAGTVYLWDATLPPPTLPDGLARSLVPLLMIALISGDAVFSVWRFRPRSRATAGIPVIAGYVELAAMAQMVNLSVAVLRSRLDHAGKLIIISANGHEQVSLGDVLAVLTPTVAD